MDNNDDMLFDEAADAVVDLGNRLAADNPDIDPWALADGLIAGAVHFWLYAHQPESPVPSDEDSHYGARARRGTRQPSHAVSRGERVPALTGGFGRGSGITRPLLVEPA